MKNLRVLLVLLCLVFTTGIVHAAPPAQDAADGAEYTVQSGDSLSLIAGRFLGSRNAFNSIVDATNAKAADDDSFAAIDDPNVLVVGQKLWIPGVDAAAIASAATSEDVEATEEGNAAETDTTTEEGDVAETETTAEDNVAETDTTTEEGDVADDTATADTSATEIAEVADNIEATTEATAETETGISLTALQNTTYSGVYDEAVAMTDGTYEGQPFVAGAASRPTLTLTELVELGDLNGDGLQDAAAIIVENSGGSGVFNYLAVVVDQDGSPVNVATHLLGDRTKIEKFFIENDQIGIDMVTQGPDDALCCPTLKITRRYQLQNGVLVNLDGEVTASQLAGANYQPTTETDDAMADSEASTEGDTQETATVEYSVVALSITGDLNGDEKSDGAVVLSSNSDAGTVYELAAVANQGGSAVILARLILEDGIAPDSIFIDANSQIILDIAGSSQIYQLQGNQLVEVVIADESTPVDNIEDVDTIEEDTPEPENVEDTPADQQA